MNPLFRFFVKVILFCAPFLILVFIYLVADPFKVIKEYDNYYEHNIVHINRDFVSTEMYIKNSRKVTYDSFIFGSSVALAFTPRNWNKYISTSNTIFSFDASGECFDGIWSKIKFIHKNGNKIKNALLIFDTGNTGSTFRDFRNNEGHIFLKHYDVYPSSKFNFHYKSFLSFLHIKFLIAYCHHKVSNHFYTYMTDTLLDDTLSYYDLITNQYYPVKADLELKDDSLNYYRTHRELFSPVQNNPQEINPQITLDYVQKLKEINEIFASDSTNFRIIISPLLNQISFNKNDLHILHNIFGKEHVFDFSGISDYTKMVSNYYDHAHLKQYFADELLTIIYNEQ